MQQLCSISLRVLTTDLTILKSLISERLLGNKTNYDCNWPSLVVPNLLEQYYITELIVSIRKFSIVIGSRAPICLGISARFELFVIGYTRDFHTNYLRFNCFLRNVFYSFLNLGKAMQMVLLKRISQKTFLNPTLVKIPLISNWTSCRTIQGIIVLVISNRPRAPRASDFKFNLAVTARIVNHLIHLQYCENAQFIIP